MEAVKVEKYGNNIIEVHYDTDPDNPRDWENLGTMVCFHRRYNLGDKHDFTVEEISQNLLREQGAIVILPLFLYDHSGLSMSTSTFRGRAPHAGWDSGAVGYIYATKEDVTREFGDDYTEEKVEDILRSEVEVYDKYLRGEVYGYRILAEKTCDSCNHTEREEMDSCWGYYSEEEALASAKDMVYVG